SHKRAETGLEARTARQSYCLSAWSLTRGERHHVRSVLGLHTLKVRAANRLRQLVDLRSNLGFVNWVLCCQAQSSFLTVCLRPTGGSRTWRQDSSFGCSTCAGGRRVRRRLAAPAAPLRDRAVPRAWTALSPWTSHWPWRRSE